MLTKISFCQAENDSVQGCKFALQQILIVVDNTGECFLQCLILGIFGILEQIVPKIIQCGSRVVVSESIREDQRADELTCDSCPRHVCPPFEIRGMPQRLDLWPSEHTCDG